METGKPAKRLEEEEEEKDDDDDDTDDDDNEVSAIEAACGTLRREFAA